jgi:hypothetical protein
MRHEGSTLITDVLIIPGSLRPEHVQPLVDEIRLGKDLSVEVRVAPRRGYGVTWWEVLIFYLGAKALDLLAGHPIQLLLDEITEKVKRWYKQRCFEACNKRPDPPVVRSRRAGTPASQGLVTAPACRQVRLPQPPLTNSANFFRA